METSRRDTIIALVACLIIVAVLIPAIVITKRSNAKNHDPRETYSSTFSASLISTTGSSEVGNSDQKSDKESHSKREEGSLISAEGLLNKYPLIDGHNDFPYSVRENLHNDISELHMDYDLASLEPWASDDTSQTDLGRLRRGQVGAQFWSAYIGCEEARAGEMRGFLTQMELAEMIHIQKGEAGVCRKLEHLLGGGGEGAQWWRHLLDSDTRTGREFRECWSFLQREAGQCCDYLGKELEGPLAAGPAVAANCRSGRSCRQELTEQREELKEAALRDYEYENPH